MTAASGDRPPYDMAVEHWLDLKAGRRTCGDPLCPDPYCWQDRDEDGDDTEAPS